MKSILVIINDRAGDVISYKGNKRDPQKEKELVIKFIDSEICDIKDVMEVKKRYIVITSKKDTIYQVTWEKVTCWNDEELED